MRTFYFTEALSDTFLLFSSCFVSSLPYTAAMFYFHGTSIENLQSIKKNGLSPHRTNWQCSKPDTTYFWSPLELADADCEPYEEEPERWDRMALNNAADSAFYACTEAKDFRRIVLAVHLDKTFNVEPDESCENMYGAVCVNKVVPFSRVAAILTDQEDLTLLKPYIWNIQEEMNYAVKGHRTPLERIIMKVFKNAKIYDCLSELCYSMIETYRNPKYKFVNPR